MFWPLPQILLLLGEEYLHKPEAAVGVHLERHSLMSFTEGPVDQQTRTAARGGYKTIAQHKHNTSKAYGIVSSRIEPVASLVEVTACLRPPLWCLEPRTRCEGAVEPNRGIVQGAKGKNAPRAEILELGQLYFATRRCRQGSYAYHALFLPLFGCAAPQPPEDGRVPLTVLVRVATLAIALCSSAWFEVPCRHRICGRLEES